MHCVQKLGNFVEIVKISEWEAISKANEMKDFKTMLHTELKN